jgi:hypothetical protein
VAGTRKRYSISAGNNGDTYARQTYALERLYAWLSEEILENQQEHAAD